MQLRFNRSLQTLSFEATLDLSPDDRQRLTSQNLQSVVLFNGATVADLELGKTFKFASLAELNAGESTLSETVRSVFGEGRSRPAQGSSSDEEDSFSLGRFFNRFGQDIINFIMVFLFLLLAWFDYDQGVQIDHLKKLIGQ